MEFTNKFHIPLPLEDAWTLMLDVPRIMPALPGARLTGVADNNKYLGSVSVKLGPVKLSFDGQAEIVRKDDAQYIAWLRGSGLDPKGRGAAQSEFSFALMQVPGGTDVTVTTQLQLSGAVAQYGRGSGMIAEVASHILKQFEENLAESLSETAAANPPVAPAPAPARMSPASATIFSTNEQTPPPDVQMLFIQAQALLGQSQAVLAATRQALLEFQIVSAAAAEQKKKNKTKELNMLSIGMKAMWSQAQQAIGGFFHGKNR